MKVFLDTNVIVDFCAVREPFFHDASMIIDMANKRLIDLVVSSLSFINVAYILRKHYPKELVMDKLDKLMSLCDISPIDREVVKKAIRLQARDFEDAIQYFSACKSDVDIIITRDATGFAEFDVLIQTPTEFLRACMKNGN